MAGEFVHADVGGELTEAEYHALLGHILNDQARGDLIMSNAAGSGLVRLPKGTEGQRLLMGADDPQWSDGGSAALHLIPAAISVTVGDHHLFVPMFKDTTGAPDRCVVVTVLTSNTISVVEYRRLGDTWIFDPAECAYDTSVALSGTAQAQTSITAFAIDSPVATGDRVLFIAYPTSGGTFEMDSIVLTPGGSTLSVTAVTIGGANQPSDSTSTATAGIPLSATRVMTFYQDDAHFATVTESGGTYSFTYADSKVLAVDTSIGVTGSTAMKYSGLVIGTQLVLLLTETGIASSAIWEMTTAAVLTEEFFPFRTGLIGSDQSFADFSPAAISAIGGAFSIASPVAGDGADGQKAGYIVSIFPLDDI